MLGMTGSSRDKWKLGRLQFPDFYYAITTRFARGSSSFSDWIQWTGKKIQEDVDILSMYRF